MKSFFQRSKGLLLRRKGAFLLFLSIIYTGFICYLSGIAIPQRIYILAPLTCLFSLPLSGIYLWFSKKAAKKLTLILSLYCLPTVAWLIAAGSVYAYSSFFEGEFFLSLSLFIYFITCAVTSASIALACAITILIYKRLAKIEKTDK